MNDIELESNLDGTYDWVFNMDGVSNVSGIYALASASVHAVLLEHDELAQALYVDKGCTAHEYLKDKKTDNNINLAREAIIVALEEIEDVLYADVQLENTQYGIKLEIRLTTTDGEVVTINGV